MPKTHDNAKLILCSDIHLSDRPPIFRSAEPDWFEAMARPLRQLREEADLLNVPIACCGDIFDKWNPSPALINFAIEELPTMYAVPGQHDLPHHRLEDIKSSAYWTLVETGNIINLEYGKPVEVNDCFLYGFPWGSELKPCENDLENLCLHVAIVHKYIWDRPENSFPGANPMDRTGLHSKGCWQSKLSGHHVMAFGDNHKGFVQNMQAGPSILNCGGFMRRSKDEIEYTPSIGLVDFGGQIERWALDCSEDKYLKQDPSHEIIDEDLGLPEFIAELKQLGSDELDFKSAVENYCEANNVDDETREIVMGAIE